MSIQPKHTLEDVYEPAFFARIGPAASFAAHALQRHDGKSLVCKQQTLSALKREPNAVFCGKKAAPFYTISCSSVSSCLGWSGSQQPAA